MRVVFRAPHKKEIEIEGEMTLQQLAKKLNFSLESHLVVRNGKMLTPDEVIREEDVVEVFSAISGG